MLKKLIAGIFILGIAGFICYEILCFKNSAVIGYDVYPLEDVSEKEAFKKYLDILKNFKASKEAEELQSLCEEGHIWVAKKIPARSALFVSTTDLVKRIYIDKTALMDPVQHLSDTGRFINAPNETYALNFAMICIAGTLFHELVHYNGTLSEPVTYQKEIAWYEGILKSKDAENPEDAEYDMNAFEFAAKSAILTAQEALKKEEASQPQ